MFVNSPVVIYNICEYLILFRYMSYGAVHVMIRDSYIIYTHSYSCFNPLSNKHN